MTESQLGETYRARITMGLTIEEMGPQGGVWRWSFEDFSILEYTPNPEMAATLGELPLGPGLDRTLSAAMRLITDLDLVCRVNAQGACIELLNWPQWRERIENVVLLSSGALIMVDAYENSTSPSSGSGGGMDALTLALRGQSAAPAAEAAAGPDMLLIANAIDAVSGVLLDSMDSRTVGAMLGFPFMTDVQGLSLREGQTQATEALYPLPFGAEAIRVTGAVTLEDIDRRAGVARFNRTANLDAASVTTSLTTLMQNASGPIIATLTPILPAGSMGEDPAATAEFMSSMVGAMMASFDFSFTETGTALVDLNTGLLRSGTVTQVFAMNGPDGASLASQTSVTTFTLTPAAPRRPRLGAGSGDQ